MAAVRSPESMVVSSVLTILSSETSVSQSTLPAALRGLVVGRRAGVVVRRDRTEHRRRSWRRRAAGRRTAANSSHPCVSGAITGTLRLCAASAGPRKSRTNVDELRGRVAAGVPGRRVVRLVLRGDRDQRDPLGGHRARERRQPVRPVLAVRVQQRTAVRRRSVVFPLPGRRPGGAPRPWRPARPPSSRSRSSAVVPSGLICTRSNDRPIPCCGEKNWSASASEMLLAVQALEAPKPSMRW